MQGSDENSKLSLSRCSGGAAPSEKECFNYVKTSNVSNDVSSVRSVIEQQESRPQCDHTKHVRNYECEWLKS